MPIVVVLFAGVAAGLLTAFFVRRFPALDPAAPHLAPDTVSEVAATQAAATFLHRRINPREVTGLLLTTALAIALGAAVAIGSLFIMVQHNALLARYDLSAAHWGATNATSSSTHFLRDVSQLGGTAAMIVIAVVVAIVEYLRTRVRAVFAFMLTVALGATLLMNLTKWIVDRPRPNVARLTGFSGSSFPSGHATFAAATFAGAAFLIGRGRPQSVKVIAAGCAAGIAVAVATTRVLLGVHWLTDVLAGLALGWGWFALCSIAFGGRVLRFGRPVEIAEEAVARPG